MPLSFLKKYLGSRTKLGVDIGTASIKVAEVTQGDKGPELKNYGYLESYEYLDRSNAAFQTSTLHADERRIAAYIKRLLSESKIVPAPIIASLPSFAAFTTLIDVPQLTDEELAGSMAMHAKQYIPIPIEEATLDWFKVGERVDEGVKKFQIFLTSIPNAIVARTQKIFELADLPLAGLEIEGAGLARSLTRQNDEPVLIIDIGSRSTSLIIAKNGQLRFVGQTDFSGGSLTQIISNALHLSGRRAEDLKRQRGLMPGAGEEQLSTILEPIVDVIINEGLRVKQNYEISQGGKISKAILSGGGANLPGILPYFAKATGLSVSKAEPFAGLAHSEGLAPFINELGPFLSVAVGLALKE